MRGGSIAGALLLSLAVTGCTTQLERAPVTLHSASTSEGVAWTYRGEPFAVEGILVGSQGEYHLPGDAAHLRSLWSDLGASVTLQNDNVSPYILIRLGDRGTGRLNPLRGGPVSWGLQELQDTVAASLGVLGQGTEPRYSMHLVTLEDDMRPLWSDEVVAQVRLRRLSSAFIEAGIDPRVISGQVWDKREIPEWKLALVLRPFRYGHEQTSTALVVPGSF